MATTNNILDKAMETIQVYAEKVNPNGYNHCFSGNCLGVPCGTIRLHKFKREAWPNGIFQNGPFIIMLIQNDGERSTCGVDVLSKNVAPTTNRTDTYSVSGDCRRANRRSIESIVKHCCQQIDKFITTP